MNADVRSASGWPRLTTCEAKDDVSADQTSKQHRLRGKKGDHAESANLWWGFGAPGVLTVNVDNGFGAGVAAARIARAIAGGRDREAR